MKTFADRAKDIKKKYKYADRVSADKESMDSELFALFKEQEDFKRENDIPGPTDQSFGSGGPTTAFTQYTPTWDELRASQTIRETAEADNPLLKTWDTPSESGLRFGENFAVQDSIIDTDIGIDSETGGDKSNFSYLNAISGASSAMGNLANMLSVEDPKTITPHTVNPSFKFRGFDLEPYETALANESASTRYKLTRSGTDFDTMSSGIEKINQGFSTALGKVSVEQERLNNAEGARGDEIMNKAQYYNTEKRNQADIDKAIRTDAANQQRRDYLAGLSENIANIFKDEADRTLANELSPDLFNLGIYQGLLNT